MASSLQASVHIAELHVSTPLGLQGGVHTRAMLATGCMVSDSVHFT